MSRDSYEADRDRRDDAGVGPYPEHGASLTPLKELHDWDVDEGEPDIRGWEVRTLSGRVIGKVDDLLIDTEQREVVMMDIDVEGGHQRTLAPIRAAQIDRAERIVRIDSNDLHEDALPKVEREVVERRPADREVVHREAPVLADKAEPERRTVRYARNADEGEKVIERRPVVVEEVVVRRRVVDNPADEKKDEERRP